MPATALVKPRKALCWSAGWFLVAMLVAAVFAVRWGTEQATQFLAAYLVEFSLSLDNLAVIAMIFATFGVAAEFQPRVLFWGILGAMVMRGLMILGGLAMVRQFHWLLYLMGLFLVLTGFRWAVFKQREANQKSPILQLAQKWLPVANVQIDGKFLAVHNGRRALTPLALVLLTIEMADLLFASDSVPAIFSITQNAFIIFTSNILAIVSLRWLYFALAGALAYFRFLKSGLAAILIFIGAKMLAAPRIQVSTIFSLAIILGILVFSIALSVLVVRKESTR